WFQWRNNNLGELFLSAKSDLREQIAQSRPAWAKMDNAQLAIKLGMIAGIHSDNVVSVLEAQRIETDFEFTRFIEIISRIGKKL
ncbi:MAG: hypothetical protein ACRERV_12395, partial [Methylococcales bacterium]